MSFDRVSSFLASFAPRHATAVLVLVGLAAPFATGCAASSEAPAEEDTAETTTTEAALTTNCGIASCSIYLSRSETRATYDRINNYGWVAGAALGAAIGAKGGPWGAVGGAIIGTFGSAHVLEMLETATQQNKCFKVTYVRGSDLSPTGPQITWISTNNGEHCHD